jgi:hypothetical protein
LLIVLNTKHQRKRNLDTSAMRWRIMESETCSDYICFNIQSYFCQEPDGPIMCLICASDLLKSIIEPSRAMKNKLANPSYECNQESGSSYLFTCNQCHWWCVREGYEFIDKEHVHRHGDDYLIVGTAEYRETETSRNPPVKYTEPWLKALDDPNAYEKVKRFPKEFAVLFKGGMTWEQRRA